MTQSDLKRVKFANWITQFFARDLRKKDKRFYLNRKSFIHELNPRDQARIPRMSEWRKKNEGLTPNWVANGNKIRSGGKIAHLWWQLVTKKVRSCVKRMKK